MFRRNRHKHSFKVLVSHTETIKDRIWTHILFQWDCGEWYVDTIPGAFTKEELLLLK